MTELFGAIFMISKASSLSFFNSLPTMKTTQTSQHKPYISNILQSIRVHIKHKRAEENKRVDRELTQYSFQKITKGGQ
jgi:hypothetical protein